GLAGTETGFRGGDVSGVASLNSGNISGIGVQLGIAHAPLQPLRNPLSNRQPLSNRELLANLVLVVLHRARGDHSHPSATAVSAAVSGCPSMCAARRAAPWSGNRAVQNRAVVSAAASRAAAFRRFCRVPAGSRRFAS